MAKHNVKLLVLRAILMCSREICVIGPDGSKKTVQNVNGLLVDFVGSSGYVEVYEGTDFKRCHFVCGENVSLRVGKSRHHIKDLIIGSRRSTGASISIGHNFSCVGCQVNMNESSSVTIGNDCMFSFGITMFSSDGHAIIDTATGECINSAKDITIADHVWIGYGVTLLKGAMVPSNCIVGAHALVTNQISESGAIVAGSPAKVIRRGVTWSRQSPANYISQNSLASL